jgi:hypothetical protein
MTANIRDLPARAHIKMLPGGIEGEPKASRRYKVAMILQESVIICCLVALLGICVSEIIRNITTTKISTLQVAMSFYDLFYSTVQGFIVRASDAIYPAYIAA